MNKNTIGVADFETTKEDSTQVWLCGVKTLTDNTKDSFNYFDNIKDFILYCLETYKSLYFHNLKFDGSFIINYLHSIGYKYFDNNLKNVKTGKPKKQPRRTYTLLVSDVGQFYNLAIKDEFDRKLTVMDSLKLLPFSVSTLGSAIGFDKQEINEDNDYSIYRIDNQSIDYLHTDIEIVRRYLVELFDMGLTKPTCASNSLASFKKLIGKEKFDTWFPNSKIRKDFEEIMYNYTIQAYFGGECYPKDNEHQEAKSGVIIDNNSMYPSRCYGSSEVELPYGYPITDELTDIKEPGNYVQVHKWRHIDHTISFMTIYIKSLRIKPGYNPNLRKHELYSTYNTNECITKTYQNFDIYDESAMWISNGNNMLVRLTEIDFNYMLEAYEVEYLIIDYMRFKSQKGMMTNYFEYWADKKIEYTKTGNKVRRQIAKNMMNSLTGKFGMNTKMNYKIPYFDKGENVLKFTTNKVEYGYDNYKTSIYPPIIAVITAEGRRCLNNAIVNIGLDKFLYTDTDSVHFRLPDNINYNLLINNDENERQKLLEFFSNNNVDIDSSKLGAWDIEGIFECGKYLRCKTYIEHITYDFNEKEQLNKLEVKACGMTKGIHKYCTFENFELNTCYTPEHLLEEYTKKGFNCVVVSDQDCKLLPKQVEGGVVLKEYGFSLNHVY